MKPAFDFNFSVEIDKRTGATIAAYFRVRRGKSAVVKEFADGAAFADYDAKGCLLGIELLGPCEIEVLDKIAATDEARVRSFLHRQVPRKKAWAEPAMA